MVAELLSWYANTSPLNKGMVWAQVASTVLGAGLLTYSWLIAWFVAHRPRANWPQFVTREVNGPEGTWVITALGVALLVPYLGLSLLCLLIFNGCLLGIQSLVLRVYEKFGWTPPYWLG